MTSGAAHSHLARSVTTGVAVAHPSMIGGWSRTDLEFCACGALRTVTIIAGDRGSEMVLPGLWREPPSHCC